MYTEFKKGQYNHVFLLNVLQEIRGFPISWNIQSLFVIFLLKGTKQNTTKAYGMLSINVKFQFIYI